MKIKTRSSKALKKRTVVLQKESLKKDELLDSYWETFWIAYV